MNRQPGIGKTFMAVLAMGCLIAVSLNAQAQNDKNVRMEVNANQDALTIVTAANENGCPWFQPRGKGCVKAKRGERIIINLHMQGETKCTLENAIPNTHWTLAEVYLGGYDAGNKPAGFGFTTTPDADYQNVKSDFDVADRATGRVNPESRTDRLIKMKDENQSQYVAWYKVEAKCERSDGQPPYLIYADPRIRNTGN